MSRATAVRLPASAMVVAALAAAALATGTLPAAPAAASSAPPLTGSAPAGPATGAVGPGVYLVVLHAPPLASYGGDRPGYRATSPGPVGRFRAHTPAADAYRSLLAAQQSRVLSALGDPPVVYRYQTAINGFAVHLTTEQVKQATQRRDVALVEPDSLATLQGQQETQGTEPPALLPRLSAAVDAQRRTGRGVGAGIVIGVVDSGIWPENPSFAGVPADRSAVRRVYPGFSGRCERGERWRRSRCDTKVIAARSFVTGFGIDNLSAAEYRSPRDSSGHGSHTAAVAAGNAGVDVQVAGQDFGRISGLAPGAALAIYKACWTAPDPSDDGCATSDTVKAIDQAVSDGVDVISYSVSGGTDALSVTGRAFLHATQAGVFVAAAAGDGGPRAGSVNHASPWVTTVAATNQRHFQGSVQLGDSTSYPGSMASRSAVASARLVYARAAAADGHRRKAAAECTPGSLDAALVDDAVVVCDRGVVPRITKSRAVAQAGGVAMVLVNTAPADTYSDLHFVPTVHVRAAAGRAIKQYIATHRVATAALRPVAAPTAAPARPAEFSARGPAASTHGDILKPDLAAPGVDVVSAAAPPSDFGRLWDLSSGTSIAAPAVAGSAARVFAAHPGWSPAAVKSALSTTASPVGGSGGVFAGGSGELDPLAASDPGLVYDTGGSSWQAYVSAHHARRYRPRLAASVSDINSASIAVGSLVGRQDVRRRVTNVTDHSETYTADIGAPHGVQVSVRPATIVVEPGQTRSFTVAMEARRNAHYGRFASGELTWTGSQGHVVRSPLVVRPEAVRTAPEVNASGRRGTATLDGRAGVTGTVRARIVGLVAGTSQTLSLQPGRFDPTYPAPSSHVARRSYTVGPATMAARFEVKAATDVDLYVYRNGRLVEAATSGSADEMVTLDHPRPGSYDVYVEAVSGPDRVDATVTGWVLHRSDRSGIATRTVKVDVTGSRRFAVNLRWSGLDRSRRWFGFVEYPGTTKRTYLTLN